MSRFPSAISALATSALSLAAVVPPRGSFAALPQTLGCSVPIGLVSALSTGAAGLSATAESTVPSGALFGAILGSFAARPQLEG